MPSMPVLRLMLRRCVSTVRTLIPSVLGDLLVAGTVGEHGEHFLLALRQQRWRGGRRSQGPHAGRVVAAAGQNRFYGREQFLGRRVLEHVGAGAGSHGLAHVFRAVVHGQHHQAGGQTVAGKTGDEVDAAFAAQADVDQCEIGILLADQALAGLGIAGFADDAQMGERFQADAHSVADEGMVVDDRHADDFRLSAHGFPLRRCRQG